MVFLPLMLIWLRDPMYFNSPCRWAMVAFAALIGLITPEITSENHGGTIAAAAEIVRPGSTSPSGSSMSVPTSKESSLWREGTRLNNRVGQFTQADGGWYFNAAQSESASDQAAKSDPRSSAESTMSQSQSVTPIRVRSLENLALQRIVQMIQQDPSDNRWMINGVITEYFGENRLLIVLAFRAPIDDEAR